MRLLTDWLRQWFNLNTAWRLRVEPELARLKKTEEWVQALTATPPLVSEHGRNRAIRHR